MQADKTDEAPEVDALLSELGRPSGGLPYYALFQPNKEPVHFEGVYTTPGSFLQKFTDAGVEFKKVGESSSNTAGNSNESPGNFAPLPVGSATANSGS